jgi:hypothetical protein
MITPGEENPVSIKLGETVTLADIQDSKKVQEHTINHVRHILFFSSPFLLINIFFLRDTWCS